MDAVSNNRRLWAAAIAVLAVAGCAQTPPNMAIEEIIEPPDPAIAAACEARPALFLNPRIARQGATLQLVPAEPVGAFAPREIRPEFLKAWTAQPAGQVSIAKDGKSMTVLDTSTPGTEVTISATYCDKPFARTIRIVGRNEIVLAGMWHQESVSCTGETPTEPVREFDISDRDGFSITYAPFESYKDFWGDVAFDAKAGTLGMTIKDGNRVPSGAKLSGKASMTPEGKLVLDGFFLSQPQAGGGVCSYVFGK